MDSNKPRKPRRGGEDAEALETNPFLKIELEPEYANLDGTIREFFIQVFSGYIWEAKHTQHFMAYHPELEECERIRDRLMWLRDKEEWWPDEDAQLELALIDAVRLTNKLWD